MSVRWSEVLTLYHWELRSALRDRTIVINSIVLPLVLYPVMLWAIFNGMAFVRGQTDDLESRIALVNASRNDEALASWLRHRDHVRISEDALSETAAEDRLRRNELDAVVIVEPVEGEVPNNVRVRLVFEGTRERSDLARGRIVDAVNQYRDDRLRRESVDRGIDRARWTAFALEQRNTASRREMGSFLLGLMLPLFFVVMVALGCLNPAIDATAGERERHTWETLMTTAASRGSIVTAKYLAVTTLGGLAGLLNVMAMMLTMRGVLAPMMGGGGEAVEFRLPLAAVPILFAGAVLLAGLLAAGMMLLAAFARTFREGQAMVTPFYLAAVLPAMFLGTPGVRLTVPLALVPVVNVALVVREAIGGTIKPVETLIAVIAAVVFIALLLRLAAAVLAFENVVIGSHSGSLMTFLRRRQPRQG